MLISISKTWFYRFHAPKVATNRLERCVGEITTIPNIELNRMADGFSGEYIFEWSIIEPIGTVSQLALSTMVRPAMNFNTRTLRCWANVQRKNFLCAPLRIVYLS